MDHETFVSDYSAGRVKPKVSRGAAMRLFREPGHIPEKYREEQIKLRLLTFVPILVGMLLVAYASIYVALTLVLFGVFMGTRASRAMKDAVVEFSLANGDFYRAAIKFGLMTVEPARP